MDVIDPGHEYFLYSLDGGEEQRLVFVKREGQKYPGNVGHHPGTNMQEVLRALIERCTYLNRQHPCQETSEVITLLISALMRLEERAARRHGRTLLSTPEDVVGGVGMCYLCGHVGCSGTCRKDH